MSLRKVHLLFIALALILADMLGAWAVWEHSQSGNFVTLALGIVSFLLGFALAGYAIWFVGKMDRSQVT